MIDTEDINSYFASISSLASKVVLDCEIVKQSCMRNGRWEGLSVEQQEELLDRFMIDQTDQDVEHSLNCFPVYKINCGEKLVVDFEHDDGCTTWIDEHSAPFSWKTKSQQDLTLADLDDVSNAKDECKKNRFAKRPRSPDRGVLESAAMFDDKDKNEIEKMFEKFGIKAYDGDGISLQNTDENEQNQNTFVSPSHAYNEQTKLLEVTTDAEYENQSFAYESEALVAVEGSESPRIDVWKSEASIVSAVGMPTDDSDIGSRETLNAPKKTKRKKHEKGKNEKQNRKKENILLADVDTSPIKNQLRSSTRSANQYELIENPPTPANNYSTSLGSVSPVYLADPGESCTDDPLSPIEGNSQASAITDANSKEHVLELSVFELDTSMSATLLPDDSGRGGESVIKTGFDFLDEW